MWQVNHCKNSHSPNVPTRKKPARSSLIVLTVDGNTGRVTKAIIEPV